MSEPFQFDEFLLESEDLSLEDGELAGGECACQGCVLAPLEDGMCEFCGEHCVDPRELRRQHERSLCGILAWRTHVVRDALEEEGYDSLVWWPLVQLHGTLARAERWLEEQRALDAELDRLLCRDA